MRNGCSALHAMEPGGCAGYCHLAHGGGVLGVLLERARGAPDEHRVLAPNLRVIVPMCHWSWSVEMCL